MDALRRGQPLAADIYLKLAIDYIRESGVLPQGDDQSASAPRDQPETAERWTIDRVLDRLYDCTSMPAWLLCALEDVRQDIEAQAATLRKLRDRADRWPHEKLQTAIDEECARHA